VFQQDVIFADNEVLPQMREPVEEFMVGIEQRILVSFHLQLRLFLLLLIIFIVIIIYFINWI
jgi:hypothetical protein